MGIEKELKTLNIKTIITTMILSALGFLVAFQWRDVIKETIELMIPAGEGLLYKYAVAILITIIAVVVTFILIRFQQANIIPDKYEEKLKKKLKLKK
ncbi:MAG: DUF5654 family protein [Candidatus Aenigmatarchaeota archaeon]